MAESSTIVPAAAGAGKEENQAAADTKVVHVFVKTVYRGGSSIGRYLVEGEEETVALAASETKESPMLEDGDAQVYHRNVTLPKDVASCWIIVDFESASLWRCEAYPSSQAAEAEKEFKRRARKSQSEEANSVHFRHELESGESPIFVWQQLSPTQQQYSWYRLSPLGVINLLVDCYRVVLALVPIIPAPSAGSDSVTSDSDDDTATGAATGTASDAGGAEAPFSEAESPSSS